MAVAPDKGNKTEQYSEQKGRCRFLVCHFPTFILGLKSADRVQFVRTFMQWGPVLKQKCKGDYLAYARIFRGVPFQQKM